MAKRRPNMPAEEDESWLITYADAVTLLMAFFVMLLSFSDVNLPAFESVMSGIQNEFGRREAPERPLFNLAQSMNQLIDEAEISQNAVESGFDELGVVIEFESRSFFAPGSAILLPKAKKILIEIAFALEQPPYDLYFVDIEGHTDDTPTKTEKFPSNWELSVARALSALRYILRDRGVKDADLEAAGYAGFRPKFPNDSPENRARNRRVDFAFLIKEKPKTLDPEKSIDVGGFKFNF